MSNENETVAVKRGRPPVKSGIKWDDLCIEYQIERVERVQTVLGRLTDHQIENHFDMTFWGDKTSCGTVGCAAGHCSFDPWFQRRGFGSRFYQSNSGELHHQWTGLYPMGFFGSDMESGVFTNDACMEGGSRKMYDTAMKRTATYLGFLRAKKAIYDAREVLDANEALLDKKINVFVR